MDRHLIAYLILAAGLLALAALTVRAAGTRKGADEIVAADLSEAVLRSYPTKMGGVTGVP